MTTPELTTILALLIGALITLLDGAARYNTRDRLSLAGAAADGVDIPPRYFTSERGYLASVLLYLAVMEIIYFGPAVGVPIAFADHGPAQQWLSGNSVLSEEAANLLPLTSTFTFPIIWSLLLVGALRYLPWINMIEPSIRRLCHNIAEIPHYVHELSRTLYTVPVKVEVAFPQGYRDDLPLVTANDFNAPASTEEHAWARLSYLMRELEEMYTELGNLPAVHFGARFAEEYENAASEFRSLTYRMAGHVEARAAGARLSALGPDHRFKADLRRAFARASLLTVVLLNLKYRSEGQIGARLKKLGFDVSPDRLRSDVGPDAAITVLALALVLFVVTPIAVAGVDVVLRQLIGTGWINNDHPLRYADTIVYPAEIIRANSADLLRRVMITFTMSFVILLVLTLVNLTIARRLAGIDPREMFEGQWLRRPYGKYIYAAFISAVVCLATGAGLMLAFTQAGLGDQVTGGRPDLALIVMWLPAMVLIALPVHVFAHSRGQSFGQVLGEGVLSGLVWAVATFVTSYFFFIAMHTTGADHGHLITPPEALGGAVYQACTAFFLGAPFMATLLFVSKSAREIGDRERTPLFVVEGGKQAA